MGFGIALAGGGTRGAAHVGVLLALNEAGLYPSAVAGASAGSIVGGLYAAGIPAKRLQHILLSLSRSGRELIDPDIKGLLLALVQLLTRRPVTMQGLVKGDRLERFLCSLTGGKAMHDLSLRTIIPAVNIRTGETIAYTNTLAGVRPLPRVRWSTEAPLCRAIRASCAFPAVFRPVTRDGGCLVDGGLTDNLPVNLLLAAGVPQVLAVDVSEEYEPPETEGVIEIVSHSLTILTTRMREYVARGEALLLHPRLPEKAGLLTFREMAGCMQEGYRQTKEQIPLIRALFASSAG
ncbi:MAG TPA: patatin-like phospholipase family protein [Firmicutes bacterium]|nr:patatin-like phospholipase family protein [Bacillota bacterium]